MRAVILVVAAAVMGLVGVIGADRTTSDPGAARR
jgi:hypothetical protein